MGMSGEEYITTHEGVHRMVLNVNNVDFRENERESREQGARSLIPVNLHFLVQQLIATRYSLILTAITSIRRGHNSVGK